MARSRNPHPRIYCTVAAGSAAMKVIEQLDARDEATTKAIRAMVKAIGIPTKWSLLLQCDRLVGFASNPYSEALEFARENPEVWRIVPREQSIAPRRTGAGKPIAKRFADLPSYPSAGDVNEAFGLPRNVFTGMSIVWVSIHRPKNSPPVLGIPWICWKESRDKLPAGIEQLDQVRACELLGEEAA